MAINFTIFSASNNASKTITFDFFADILSDSSLGITDALVYSFRFTTTARDTDGFTYGPRAVRTLSDLALNKQKQSASNTASAYTSINAMVTDYIYDYINGHTAGQYGTSVTVKAPMNFP